MLVAPSMLSADFGNMSSETKRMQALGADIIHCDVMDGVYVPNITFGMPMIKAFKASTTLPIDAHLMIIEPEKYVGRFCDAGADIVTFHPDASKDVLGAIDIIKSKGKKCGMCVNADVPFDIVKPYLDQIDLLLIMTVQAGFGGQSFIAECLEKAKEGAIERETHGYSYVIEVDGGVSEDNIRLLADAGVDIAVAGSSVFKSENPKKTIEALKCR